MIFAEYLRKFSEKYAAFCRIFFHGVLKTAFYFCKRSFWGKLLFWKKKQFRSPFRTLRWKFSAIWQLFFDRVIVIAFYVPIRALRGEKFYFKKRMSFPYHFWTLSEKLLVFYQKILGADVKTALYFSKGLFWVEIVFLKNSFLFTVFGQWAEKLRPSSKNFSVGSLKLHSTCLLGHWVEKEFVWKEK